MAEGNPIADVKGVLSKEMAGMPVWVWLLVVGAGIAAAYLIPKLFRGMSSSSDGGISGGGAYAGQVPAGCVASGSGGECPPGYSQQQLSDGTVLCCPTNPIGGGPGGSGGGGGGGNPPPTSPPPTSPPQCKRHYTVPNWPAGSPEYGWAHVARRAKTSVSTLIRCNPGVVPANGSGHATANEVLCVSC